MMPSVRSRRKPKQRKQLPVSDLSVFLLSSVYVCAVVSVVFAMLKHEGVKDIAVGALKYMGQFVGGLVGLGLVIYLLSM